MKLYSGYVQIDSEKPSATKNFEFVNQCSKCKKKYRVSIKLLFKVDRKDALVDFGTVCPYCSHVDKHKRQFVKLK